MEGQRRILDLCVDAGETLLANGADYTAPEQPDAPLTRGRLAWMLWQAAGAPEAEPAPFSDLMPFAYYAPGVGWCDQTGIANGVPGGAFRASCAVTLVVAAQMLVRFVRQQGLTPAEVRSGAPVLASDPAPWASESVAQAWRWGLVAESTVQAEVLPAAEDGGTATAQVVTPAARESGAQTPADAGEPAGRSAGGEQELPELDSVQTEGAAQPLFDRTEHMPVKVGEAGTLDATEPDFAPRLAKAITEAEQEGARHVELKLAPEQLGKLSVELTQGKDGVLHIVFHAENEQAMKLLQEHSATLVSMLHGSHSGEIQVEVPRPQQGEQPWQQPEQQPGQQHGRNPQEQGRQRQSTEDFLQQLRLGLLGVEAE